MIKVFRLESVLIALCFLAAVAVAALCLRAPEKSLSAASGTEKLPVLIIDPGHGGEDGGAVSVTGTHESVINLDISLRAAALAGLTGLP